MHWAFTNKIYTGTVAEVQWNQRVMFKYYGEIFKQLILMDVCLIYFHVLFIKFYKGYSIELHF